MTTDIPIKFINATSNVDFEVVVFTKNFNINTPMVYYAAWQVLRAQTSVQFVYPVAMSVGATYRSGGQLITAGPFPAKLGSTWEITQESATDTAVLRESKTKNLLFSFNTSLFFVSIWYSSKSQQHYCYQECPSCFMEWTQV